jgi:hypothetical protein
VDQLDLLHEQVKMLAGDIALCTSSLKRLTEQASNNPDDKQIQVYLVKLYKHIFFTLHISYLKNVFMTDLSLYCTGANSENEG